MRRGITRLMRRWTAALLCLAAVTACDPYAAERVSGEAVEIFHQRYNSGVFSEIYSEASPTLRRTVPIQDLQRVLVRLSETHGQVLYSTQTDITFRKQDNGGPDIARVTMDTEFAYGAAIETFEFSLGPAVLLEGYGLEITRHDEAEMWQARGFGPEGPPRLDPAQAPPAPELPPEVLERLPAEIRSQIRQGR